MTSDDLGPRPEPEIEPGEPNPGGVDALPENGDRAIPDPPVSDNPSIAEKVPDPLMDEVEGGEDTSTKATRDEEHDETEESPA
ncbi:hypothetical protein [Nocardioides sp. SR21]|uniref:hypothetical protein n=1 Tax=Nocardioides sp. SR21 TaxID=2919501 RepID=UPI001FAAB679|nr:hypothetical protein [Nocardioides sp. SR21]